jgi:hypothetical protein
MSRIKRDKLDIPSQPYPTPFLDQLLESAYKQQWVSVTYHSEKGISQQTLLPLRVHTGTGPTILPKTEIPHVGLWAVFADPAGNHLGLFLSKRQG